MCSRPMSYGNRAQDAIEKAIALDPKSSQAYLARGIGNYYKPAMFGGGPELAITRYPPRHRARSQSAEAYLWLGLARAQIASERGSPRSVRQITGTRSRPHLDQTTTG